MIGIAKRVPGGGGEHTVIEDSQEAGMGHI